MCGIAGFINLDEKGSDYRVLDAILHKMVDSLRHRGPDGDGFYHEGLAWLGHRRLAIIDIEGGGQPMFNEDRSVVVVFNGEIYNHKDLRKALEGKGHVLKTRNDAEVLPHLWEEYGKDLPKYLDGMFAFAIWDLHSKTLFLARDRFGKKPLYYCASKNGVIFASELKALFCHPDCPRQVDPLALYEFLTLDYVPSPHCILKGVQKVDASSFVLFHDENIEVGRYYSFPPADGFPKDLPMDEAERIVWETLVAAVEKRLESDVPLGVFVSGGLDSTCVLRAMAEVVPASSITTFNIAFQEESYDESPFAEQVAKTFGTRHYSKVVSPEDALKVFWRLPDIADEPLGDYSIIPTFLLCASAKEHITVALSGDGGDETFLGYPTFLAHNPARWVSVVVGGLGISHALEKLLDLIPPSEKDWALEYKIKRLVRGLGYDSFDRHFVWIGGLAPLHARSLLLPQITKELALTEPFPSVRERLSCVASQDSIRKASFLYLSLYLRDGVLTKVDRASMAVALEVRSPLLDTKMVETAFALPLRYKISRTQTKVILRELLKGKVSETIVKRPKKGFGIPLARWFRGELSEFLKRTLDKKKLADEGFFDAEKVWKLVEEHLSGRKNWRKELYNLVVFELWLSRYLL